MAGGVNMVVLVGNVGADPEVRYTPGGAAVANIRLATSESWKDRATGEKQERTEWHRLVLFGRAAEVAGEHVRKGAKLYTRGRIQTRKWQDREGRDRFTTQVVVDDFQMLGGPPASGGGPASPRRRPSAPPEEPDQYDGFGDDVPF